MTDVLERVADRLVGRGWRLAVAESCTGGLVTALLTDRAGASRYLDAGLVTYSNAAKETVLGVRTGTLATHGAVSEAVAREMAAGARRVTDAEAAVAITGIAGPDGGTAEKPVGTVWIAASVGDATAARRFRFDGDRRQIREESVQAALDLLDHMLEEAG